MSDRPEPSRWDALAVTSVVGILVAAYVVVPEPIVQYGAWLSIFSIWMLWFVSFGVRWLFGEEA